MRVIRRFASQVAGRFQPEKIILFGSYTYGQPHADSDVDILVVMPARNEVEHLLETLPPEQDELTEEEFIAELDRRRDAIPIRRRQPDFR